MFFYQSVKYVLCIHVYTLTYVAVEALCFQMCLQPDTQTQGSSIALDVTGPGYLVTLI